VLISCAQGKSRSGAMATAYVMAALDMSFGDALRLVKTGRALVEPNAGFARQLREMEPAIRQVFQTLE
jgi:protein-tyrosine phosphatase